MFGTGIESELLCKFFRPRLQLLEVFFFATLPCYADRLTEFDSLAHKYILKRKALQNNVRTQQYGQSVILCSNSFSVLFSNIDTTCMYQRIGQMIQQTFQLALLWEKTENVLFRVCESFHFFLKGTISHLHKRMKMNIVCRNTS